MTDHYDDFKEALKRVAELESDLSRYKAACFALAGEIAGIRNARLASVGCPVDEMGDASHVLAEHGIETGGDDD